jgi:hypothetical protein
MRKFGEGNAPFDSEKRGRGRWRFGERKCESVMELVGAKGFDWIDLGGAARGAEGS